MCLVTAWVGYPLWLAFVARPRPLNPVAPFRGAIAIVVVARDEGARIAGRVAELRALRVPEGCRVRVVVVDDGSSDDTAARAREAAARPDPTAVEVVSQPPSGKAVGLVTGVERAAADLIVFADVRQRVPPDALAALIEPFADPTVGVVSGVVAKPATHGAGLYWRYESWVRRLESRTGSTVGATGPWYALRRELFVPPPRGLLLDDVWLPMQAVFLGARAVVAEDAVVTDVEHAPAIERDKKARTLTGNLQLLEAWPALLDPRANPIWPRFVAHKVLRLVTPYRGNAVALWRWARRDFRWGSWGVIRDEGALPRRPNPTAS